MVLFMNWDFRFLKFSTFNRSEHWQVYFLLFTFSLEILIIYVLLHLMRTHWIFTFVAFHWPKHRKINVLIFFSRFDGTLFGKKLFEVRWLLWLSFCFILFKDIFSLVYALSITAFVWVCYWAKHVKVCFKFFGFRTLLLLEAFLYIFNGLSMVLLMNWDFRFLKFSSFDRSEHRKISIFLLIFFTIWYTSKWLLAFFILKNLKLYLFFFLYIFYLLIFPWIFNVYYFF